MQNDHYIADRWLVKIIREICEARGMTLRCFSGDWLLQLQKDKKTAYILGYKFGLNNSVAANITQDKVATYQLLQAYDVPAVPHHLIRVKAGDAQWQKLPLWKEGIVMKPLTGTGGQDVAMYGDVTQARRAIEARGLEAWAASPFLKIRREVRLIMLDQKLLLSYEKIPVEQAGLKLFNLGKGVTPVNDEPSQQIIALAKKAQEVVGLRLGAIDIVELEDGEYKIIEINDGIMMENYARHSAKNRVRTKEVYTAIVDEMI